MHAWEHGCVWCRTVYHIQKADAPLPLSRPVLLQIEGEFPQILGIRESLIKYVFEPNAAKVLPLPPGSCRVYALAHFASESCWPLRHPFTSLI